MEISAAQEFVRTHQQAVMATWRANGQLQLSPVVVALDAQGQVIVSTRETAYKTKNLRRNPQVSLCVQSDGFFGPWIQIDGTAQIVSLPEALEPLVNYYRRVRGEHPDWDEYRQAMEREQRVLIRITIEHAGPDHSG